MTALRTLVVPCFVCRRTTAHQPSAFAGLKGEERALVATVCSPECGAETRRFAARRGVQLGPSQAGMMVALVGLATGGFFMSTGRELGRVLLFVGLLGAGTTRMAYPDAIPLWLARSLGLDRTRILLQWTGVMLGFAALAYAAWSVGGWLQSRGG